MFRPGVDNAIWLSGNGCPKGRDGKTLPTQSKAQSGGIETEVSLLQL